MAKKRLTVPQTGTQPAQQPTPVENMINGFIDEPRAAAPAASRKKAVNFLCDADLLLRFKLYCTRNGRTMTSVLESAMSQILLGDTPPVSRD